MKASNSKEDARTVGYEGGKIHCLWRALEQGLFPFMMNEVGELTEKNKVFVAVCEAAVKPETFEYAKWKGIGRPPVDHMAVYKAFLFKAVHDVPTTKMTEPNGRPTRPAATTNASSPICLTPTAGGMCASAIRRRSGSISCTAFSSSSSSRRCGLPCSAEWDARKWA